MKVMVTGSRQWRDSEKVCLALDAALERFGPFELMHGGAKGPDMTSFWWAMSEPTVTARPFLPDWETYGKAATHVRNDEMLRLADYVIAFWDGHSRGTKSVIDKAAKRGLAHETHTP